MTVRFEVIVYGQSNCTVPCQDSAFGGSALCQKCGFQYVLNIYVEPLITGTLNPDHEKWTAVAQQEISAERCEGLQDAATVRGWSICPLDAATSYKMQQLTVNLCSAGPILDFTGIRATFEPARDARTSAGANCDGVTTGCHCWWQFNPTSNPAAPCTPTTDSTFVNCMDVTFGSGWQNTDWDEDGTTPSTDSWWFSGWNCGDFDTFTAKSTNDVTRDFIPCNWTFEKSLDIGSAYGFPRKVSAFFRLSVVQASTLNLGGGTHDGPCWDTKGFSACTGVNTYLQEDVALATFSNYKFWIQSIWYMQQPANPLGGGPFIYAQIQWLSQNDFSLANIWSSGAIAANPLKPFQAWSGRDTNFPGFGNCSTWDYHGNICIFTPPGSISFPTTRAEEFHCKSKHTIPNVTISPHSPTNC